MLFKHHCEGSESTLRTLYFYKPWVSDFFHILLIFLLIFAILIYYCCYKLVISV